ncbi:MAG: 3'-5' exonuclease domain-containing protein 2 [Desulfobulbus sp.]|nr:MAG: 3'-5' exonuclease domain-containing protein 2 [Desulfobulbus sp.]
MQHKKCGTKRQAVAGRDFARRITRDEINDLPLQRWQGPIHLLTQQRQALEAIDHLRREKVLGFDTETRPAFQKGCSYTPALLQLATRHEVFLFRLAPIGLPDALRDILADPAIIKTGVSLSHDLRELEKIAPFSGRGFIDLAGEAKQLHIKNHGLRGLCAVLLGFRISKSQQTSNWSRKQLSEAQLRYAATDAWAGRELYFALKNLGEHHEKRTKTLSATR